MDNLTLGKIGEDTAAGLLHEKGYSILERNYRCREGEIDIVAELKGKLCFVEVKTRQGTDFGRPADAVTGKKQRNMRRAAVHYLVETDRKRGLWNIEFQVIEVAIGHIRNAF